MSCKHAVRWQACVTNERLQRLKATATATLSMCQQPPKRTGAPHSKTVGSATLLACNIVVVCIWDYAS